MYIINYKTTINYSTIMKNKFLLHSKKQGIGFTILIALLVTTNLQAQEQIIRETNKLTLRP